MPFIDIEGEVPTGLDGFTTEQAYNILDCNVTAQLFPAMLDNCNGNHLHTYTRGMRVLALCLEMSTKGLPIGQMCLAELLYQLERDEKKALDRLHQFCDALGARPINPRSPKDVAWLFYEHLRLPAIYEFDRKTKERKISTDIKALEKLKESNVVAIPLVNAIMSVRESSKMGSVFKRGLEPTGSVLRCGVSPTGTETGRLSSQQNVYGRGTNAQNLTDRVRQGVEAPDGYAILNLDLKTAESIAVGFLSGSVRYIEACLGPLRDGNADLHTTVTKLNWPHLQWTGDLAKDKEIAESPYYRHFSHRDMAKRGGHLTNYYGQPRGMGIALKLPTRNCEEFQAGYFKAFPELPEWHLDVIARIQSEGVIVTPLRRERRFWGRPDDQATWREAIAYAPQSLVGDVMNEGLIQVQRWLLKECRDAHVFIGRNKKLIKFTPDVADLRMQVHDAGVFLVPLEALETLAPLIQRKLQYPVDFGDLGTMLIPSDMMVGKRWNKAPKKKAANMYLSEGLKDWKPGQALHFK